jgi:hypothetical protein
MLKKIFEIETRDEDWFQFSHTDIKIEKRVSNISILFLFIIPMKIIISIENLEYIKIKL